MPEIEVNVDQFIDVDVNVEDFLDACDESEIEEVIEWLAENDYKLNLGNDTNKDLIKLINIISLTVEDEILLNNIANKY
jgi:hypothetical protein